VGFDVEGHDLSVDAKKKDGRSRHSPRQLNPSPVFGDGGLRRARSRLRYRVRAAGAKHAECSPQPAIRPPTNEDHAMKRLMILNGPNLNLLGVREPHIYGTTTLSQIRESCEQHATRHGIELSFHQSNHEGEIVDWIQSARQTADAIIINPAGYSFTSIAILDAIKAFEGPVVEVHISNIHARDEHHRHSKISSAATGVIAGLGPYGYIAAMDAVAQMKKG
jgi:3-dehydroquinate dehydratase II